MARYVDIHPDNPQARLLQQVVDALRDDALIAYPTDSGYALGSRIPSIDRYLLPIVGLVIVVSLIPILLEIRRSRAR